MRIVLCILLTLLRFVVNAQTCGIYIGAMESKSQNIKSQKLAINLNNSFELTEDMVWLTYELPQHTITIKSGTYVECDEGIILIVENTETQTVEYKRQNLNKHQQQNAESRKGPYIAVDTTTIKTIRTNDRFLLNQYKKPNAIYLCNAESSQIFTKRIQTEESYDSTFYIDEVLANHRTNTFLNSYDRRHRTKLNISDSILLGRQIDTLVADCSTFRKYVLSKNYSGEYIKELTRKLIEVGACPLVIFDLNYYFFAHENSLRPWELINYPIRTLLSYDEKLKDKLFLHMYKNQVVCNSEYLKHIPNSIELEYARKIMNQYQAYVKKTQGENLSACELETINHLAIKK